MRIAAIGVVAAWLAVLSCYDLWQRRLPNVLTLPGAAVILPAAAGALAGAYLLVHLASPAGMGAGDVKLAIGLGGLAGCFGAGVWLLAALGAPLLTVVWAALQGRAAVPHGPSMCAATAVAVALALF